MKDPAEFTALAPIIQTEPLDPTPISLADPIRFFHTTGAKLLQVLGLVTGPFSTEEVSPSAGLGLA